MDNDKQLQEVSKAVTELHTKITELIAKIEQGFKTLEQLREKESKTEIQKYVETII